VTFNEAPHVVGQLYGVPHEILRVYNTILYENVFQNPELFRTQVSLSTEQSTLHFFVFLVFSFVIFKLCRYLFLFFYLACDIACMS
jgi:hypothetical protein